MYNITEDDIYGWRGYRLSLGDISIGLVADIGGRVMSYQMKGEELFYVHPPEKGCTYDIPDQKDWNVFKTAFGFHIIGGDKVWVAPEWAWVARTPSLDLDLGRYAFDVKDGVCIMTSPVCRETGLKVIRFISLKDDGTLHLREELHNTTTQSLSKGIWCVVQIPKPFDAYVPAESQQIRSYHLEDPSLPDAAQEAFALGSWQKIPVHSSVCFKFGGIISDGRMIVLKEHKDHMLGMMWSFAVSRDPKVYAHASSIEVFNSSLFPYGEVEMHAPLCEIAPLGSVSFERTLRVASVPLRAEKDTDKFLMPMVDILDK
jgi:hypothetical protein